MSKSYVSMEQNRCIVCGKDYDTGSILLDRRLKESMEMHTVTKIGVCKECEKPGYIIIIECDPDKSTLTDNGKGQQIVKPEDAWKTGNIAHMKIKPFEAVFKTKAPECGFIFTDPEVMATLAKLQNPPDDKK